MKIIRARLRTFGGRPSEFISVKGRIKALIEKNKGDEFEFVIEEGRMKSVKGFGPDNITDLAGESIPIVDNSVVAVFNEDGTIDILTPTNEGLPRQRSVDQLKRVMKMSAKTDIGNRISDMNKQGANIQYIQNPIDTGIESYEDFEKKNKTFIPSWNLKHLLSPFSHSEKSRKK